MVAIERLFCGSAMICCVLIAGCEAMQSMHAGMMGEGEKHHVVMPADQIKLGPGPAGLPPGAMMAVLDGDPGKSGMYTIRAKLPAGYKISPHWHSATENVTVLSGALFVGAGDVLDRVSATRLDAGGFAMLPSKMHHYAYCDQETTIQIHGMGPFDINYINPADDPRKQGSTGGK